MTQPSYPQDNYQPAPSSPAVPDGQHQYRPSPAGYGVVVQPQQATVYGVGQARPQVQPRGRAVGAVVSFFVPGVGSMINGSALRGTVILISYIISGLLCLVLIGFILLPIVWIWGIVDGALSADRWNRARGIVS
jgi:TM2 domain-containing membrane protein YozV